MYPFPYQNVGQQIYPQAQMGGVTLHPILMQLLSGIFQNRGMAFPGGQGQMPMQPAQQYLGPPVQQQSQRPTAFPAQAPTLPSQAQATLSNFPTQFRRF